MYDIKQFRPTLLALLLLSFLGYAIAAEAPGVWFIATSATLLHAWLFARGSFRPMPRLVANVVTLLCAGWLVLRVRQIPGPPILAIGEFLVFLQLIKLYEQRGNRDIAQLLILSLLLMVAAAISTANLFFGIVFVIYLFLSLYCCLLFHLKTETDHARLVIGADESHVNPATLRQDQRLLPRSMRRLTLLVSSVAIVMAVFVFVFFPRGSGAMIIGNLAFKPNQAMTGFSDEVNFQDVARITQNEAVAAYVAVTHNGQPWGSEGTPLYLRGSTPDTYVSDPQNPNHWKWLRNGRQRAGFPSISAGEEYTFGDATTGGDYVQRIRLLPTGTSVLFAMPGLMSITPSRDSRMMFSPGDDVLQLQDPLTSEYEYRVVSSGIVQPRGVQRPVGDPAFPVPEEIGRFALQPEVSGSDANGSLAEQRKRSGVIGELDAKIANNFEKYLRQNFTYSLDLRNVRRKADIDPIVGFLTDFKSGHCEYFAGAMTLMCQSLGMQARMVVGFKSDAFNSIGQYYVVRQSHAHAWVEVLTPQGWQQFDPTAGGGAATESRGLWSRIRGTFDYLQYAWGNNIINYDAETRLGLIQNVDSTLSQSTVKTSQWVEDLKNWFNLENFYSVWSGLIILLVTCMVVIVLAALGYFLLERWRLRRRAQRIGLESLPDSDQLRLAAQLKFYDTLLQSLGRINVDRPSHLTPREFARSLDFLPGETYDVMQRLTGIVYRVRYGGHNLDADQQRRLMRVVERLKERIEAVG